MNERRAITTEFSRALARLRTGAAEDPGKSDLVQEDARAAYEQIKSTYVALLTSLGERASRILSE